MNNDQTIFQAHNPQVQNTQNQEQPEASIVNQPPPAPVVSEQPVAPTVLPPTMPPTEDNKSAFFKKFLKLILGLLGLIVLLFVVLFVILPIFSNKSQGKVTLSYWGLWEDSKIMQGIISDFERQNPNIVINYSKQDPKQYRERLLTRINNQTGPDIFRFHNTWYPMLSSVLLPFPSDTISKSDFSKIFYPVANKDLIKNGAIYGIPLEIDTLSLYINSQMLKAAGLKPPTTWNDFITDARAMTVKDENGKIQTAGAAMGTYDNIAHAPDILSLLFLQNGVDFNNFQASTDRITGALTFYTSFATDSNNVWDNTLDPAALAFSKGNLGMYFGYSWEYFNIKQANPNLAFEVAPAPQLPKQNVSLASYWAEGVSVKTKYQKEVMLFLKYLASKEVAQKLYADEAKSRTFGEPYARVDLGDTLKGNPNIYPFIAQAPSALSSYFVDSTFDDGLNAELNSYLGNAVNSILNGGSAESAFSTFSDGVSQVKQKYGQ